MQAQQEAQQQQLMLEQQQAQQQAAQEQQAMMQRDQRVIERVQAQRGDQDDDMREGGPSADEIRRQQLEENAPA